ncbi:MAG: hypothetical protein LBD35_06950 [Prevotellaceae bacterium]|jgi:hypothetical protein|nr:hypothetical protein [Prevotellaceae bacterium]
MKYLKYIMLSCMTLWMSSCSKDDDKLKEYAGENGIPDNIAAITGKSEVDKGSRNEYGAGIRNAVSTFKWEVDNGAVIDKDYNGRTADYQASVFITFPNKTATCNITLLIISENVDGKRSELRLAKSVSVK